MKKLLAVVLSAAMVLGMSTVAMAEETGNVATNPTLSVEGNTVYVNAEGSWNLMNEVTVTWDAAATVEKQGQAMDFVMAKTDASMIGDLVFNKTVDGQVILAAALSNDSGALLDYTGAVYYITFAEGTTTDVTMGEQTVTVGAVAPVESEEPTPVESEEPTPVESEEPTPVESEEPTPADSEKPAESKAPTADNKADATKAPATTTNKTTAAKTADVAPVATMAVLALAAAAVVVAMKKRVTE